MTLVLLGLLVGSTVGFWTLADRRRRSVFADHPMVGVAVICGCLLLSLYVEALL